MRKAKKIKKAERDEIFILLEKAYSIRSIARALGRSPNTVSYEIKNNSTDGKYDPRKADKKARVSLRNRRFQWRKINKDKELKKYIMQGLKDHWNPDEISGRMKEEKKPFYTSKTAIYEWLRTARGNKYCKYLYSERYYKKKRVKKTERVMIPDRVSIDMRSLGAENRSRYGHFEKDAVCSGKNGKGSLAVMQERKSRYVDAKKVSGFSGKLHNEAIMEMKKNKKILSLTYDNGIENRYHKKLGIPSYFCDPYSSWQKGGVENANKMIRRYIPKKTNLSKISQEYLDEIILKINNKPRKILGYRSSLEVARASGVLLEILECPNSGVN
ncbi:MAG: IS30 family transposase [bacterium]